MIGTLLFLFFLTLYFFVQKRLRFFKNNGVPYEPGYFPFGSPSYLRGLIGQVAFLGISEEIYKKYPQHKIVGYYGLFGTPILVIRDLDIMKKIMIKDFDHFMDRTLNGEYIHPETNKHFKNMLTVIEGQKWKAMRNMLTPIFTSGKIKATIPLINETGIALAKYLEKFESEESLDCKEVYQMFTAEVLGKLGCGIEPQVFDKPKDNVFYEQTMKFTGGGEPSITQIIKFIILLIAPQVGYFFKVALVDVGASEFFDKVIRQSITTRKESKEKKNDFIDLLTEAIGDFQGKDDAFKNDEVEDLIISNGLLLFFAGNDTTSSGLSVASYFLSTHQDIQEKLYNEIKDAIDDNNGDVNLNYTVLNNMKFLDATVKESLRLWGLNFFDRKCTKDYYLSDFNFTIPKGMVVQTGGRGIMSEEKYYKNPDTFDPEGHFEGDTSLYSPAYMVFGQGPRNCIGMRFALTMVKAGLVHILSKYRLMPCSKTIKEWYIDPMSPSFLPKGGLHIKLEPRK